MSIWNNSRLKTYDECPRKFCYESILGLRKKNSYADRDRDEGTLWHEVEVVWRQNRSVAMALEHIDGYFAQLIADAGLDIEREEAVEHRDYFKDLFMAYTRRYPNEFSKDVKGLEVHGITALGDRCYNCDRQYPEQLIDGSAIQQECLSCREPVRYLVGQADVLYEENGMLKLEDHKTKGGKSPSASDAYMAKWHESPQFLQYMYIFSRNMDQAVHTCTANVIAKLKTIDKRGNPFRQETVVKGERDLDAFVEDRHQLIEAIELDTKRYEEGKPAFRRNLDACHNFRLCPFFALCHPPRQDWPTLPFDVADDYEQRPDDYVSDYKKLIQEEVQ